MAIPRLGGTNIQSLPFPGNPTFGAVLLPTTNRLALNAGETYVIPPGQFSVVLGLYSTLQFKDPVSGLWITLPQTPNIPAQFESDGTNWRLANLSGCAVGGVVTNAGSGYGTTPPTITVSAGASKWLAILGPLVNTSQTVTGGTNLTYPPIVTIDPPPPGANTLPNAAFASGLQASAYAAISAGAVTGITVTDQGAYPSGFVPMARFQVDPRDPHGPGGTNTATVPPPVAMAMTGSGSVAAVVCTDPGSPLTAIPTLTFSSGAAAATVLMNFTVTGITVTAGGAGYGNAQPFGVIALPANPATPTHTQTTWESAVVYPRPIQITGASTAGGAITATGIYIADGGIGFAAIPSLAIIAGGSGLATTQGQAGAVVGGQPDLCWLQQF